MSLSQDITAEWQSLGVPSEVWAPITEVESGGNPYAVGDGGTSFGELQLHIDGGQGTGYSPNELLNPMQNVAIGGPPIAAAYQQGKQKGLSGFSLVSFTASHSGHPVETGQMPDTYQALLAKAYNAPDHSLGSVSQAMDTTDTSSQSVASILQGMGFDKPLSGKNQTINGQTIAFPTTQSGNLFQDALTNFTNGAKSVGSDVKSAADTVASPFEDISKALDNFVTWIHSGNALWLVIGLVVLIIALVAWLRG